MDSTASHAARAADYTRDGAVHVPGVLDGATLDRVTELFDRSLAEPSAAAANLARGDGTTFCQPGDVVVFDLGVLHGGAATRPGVRRRTVALRCFGPDARLAAQAGAPSRSSGKFPRFVRYHRKLTHGQPLSDQPAFPRLLGG